MTVPRVSIIIPVHDGLPLLIDQLDAVAASSAGLDAEIVVADNLSADGTGAAARSWAERKGCALTVVEASARAGDGYARNVGIGAATAPLLLFCDADDVVAPGWARALIGALEAGAEFVTGPLDVDLLNPEWVRESRGRRIFQEPASFHGIPFAHGCNMGFTRDLLDRLGPMDEDLPLGCEIELAIRAHGQGAGMCWVEGALVHYRLRHGLDALYRQGRLYGRARPLLRLLLPDMVDRRALRLDNLRRVAWLLRMFPKALVSPPARARWVWAASQVDGELRSTLQVRRL